MIEQGMAGAAGKAAAGTAGVAKAGIGKMLALTPYMPAIVVVGLAGIIAFEFWKGSKDSDAMEKVTA
jgi:hypothetical protein